MESPYKNQEPDSYKPFLIGYIAGEVLLAILMIVSLALEWISYCIFDFGLYAVYDTDGDFKYGNNVITDVQDDCDDKRYVEFNDLYCTDFCSNVDRIQRASNFMIIFGSIALFFVGLNIAFYLIRVFYEDFRLRGIPLICSFVQLFLWVIGVILYGAKGNFQDFDDEECDNYADCEDFEVLGGLVLAFVNMILLTILNLYAVLFTRKAFTDGHPFFSRKSLR
jgi:hypothetical protein